MTHPDDTDATARRAREVFEAACERVDATTAGRLRLARRGALAGPGRRPLPFVPLAAASAIALALAAWWMGQRAPAPAPIVVQPPAAPMPEAAPPTLPPTSAPGEAIVSAPPAAPAVEGLPEEETGAGDEPEWADVDDEDVELYAWLADAPVAPDAEGDAL